MDEIKIKALIDAADSAKTIQELKKALRDLKSAAVEVGESSQYFEDITKAAGGVSDRIGDLNSQVKSLGDDLFALRGAVQIGQGIAAGFSIAQGAAALFGGENQKLEESLVRLNSVMAMLNGVMAIGELIQKESTAVLATQNAVRGLTIALAGKEAVAKAQVAVANGTATATQVALNAAMTANPAGILITAIGALVAAFYVFGDSSDELKRKNDALNASLEFTRKLMDANQKAAESAADIRLREAQARGEDIREIAKLEKAKIDVQEKGARERLKSLEKELKDGRRRYSEARSAGEKELATEIATNLNKKQEEADELTQQFEWVKMKDGMVESKFAAERKLIDLKLTQDLKKQDEQKANSFKKSNDKKLDNAKSFAVDLKKINDIIYANDVRLQEALLSTWGDTYDKKVLEQMSAEEKSKKEVLDAQAQLTEDLQKQYLASKEFLELGITVTGIDDSKFQAAWTKFLSSTNAEAQKAQKALQSITQSSQDTITSIQTAAARKRIELAEQEQQRVKKILGETSKVVLAQDEYRRFYDFLGTQIDKYSAQLRENSDIIGKNDEKIKKSVQEQIDEYKRLIDLKQKEIIADKERDAINDAENVKMKEMGLISEDLLDQTRKANEANIETHNNAIKKYEEEIKLLEEEIKTREKQKQVFDEQTKSIQEKNEATKTGQLDINKRIQDFSNVLEAAAILQRELFEGTGPLQARSKKAFAAMGQDVEGIRMDIENFQEAMDDLASGKPVAFTNENFIQSSMETLASLAKDWPKEYEEAAKSIKEIGGKVRVEVDGDVSDIIKTAEGYKVEMLDIEQSILEKGKQIFEVNRDINKSQIADSLKATVLTTAIYKDKNDAILAQEASITENIRKESEKRVQDLEAIQKSGLENGSKISQARAEQIKSDIEKYKAYGTMSFKIDPIDKSEFGLEKLATDFDAELQKLNTKLIERRDQAIRLEQTIYDEELYALFKQLDSKQITQEEYDKKAETARLNHEQNVLAIQVAYGEKGQQDFVQNAKERREFVRLQREKEKNELMNHLQTLFNLEKKAADLYMQWYMQENARQDRESQKRYDDQIALIDEEQKAYETSIANRTAAEQQQEDIKDEFALRRQQAEDQRKREQNDLAEKAFDAQKANTLAQMAIEYALAIAKAWGTFGPFGLPMAGFLAAEGVIAAALVATQEFVPQYATGGLVTGPGGPKDDKINAKLSNGEAVINAKSTKMYAPLLSAINQAGGGVPIPSIGASKADEVMMMAEGGMVDNFQFSERKNTPIVHGWSQPVVVGLDYTTMRELGQIMASKDQSISIQENSISNAQDKKAKVDSRTKF